MSAAALMLESGHACFQRDPSVLHARGRCCCRCRHRPRSAPVPPAAGPDAAPPLSTPGRRRPEARLENRHIIRPMMSSMTGLEPRSLIDALPSGLLAELTAADRGSWQSIREQASRELSSSDSDPRKQFALNYALLQTYRGTVDNDAVRHALQLISLADALNDNELRSVAHSEIGELYRSMGIFDRAVRPLGESLHNASSTDTRQQAT